MMFSNPGHPSYVVANDSSFLFVAEEHSVVYIWRQYFLIHFSNDRLLQSQGDTQYVLYLICGNKKADLIGEKSNFIVTGDWEGQRWGSG